MRRWLRAQHPDPFDAILEQDAVKLLLSAALRDGPAHAYLFPRPRRCRQGGDRSRLRRGVARRASPRRAGNTPRPLCAGAPGETRSASAMCTRCATTCTCARSRLTGACTLVERADSMNPGCCRRPVEEPRGAARVRDGHPARPTGSRCCPRRSARVASSCRSGGSRVALWQRGSPRASDAGEAEQLARAAGGTLAGARRLLDPDEAQERRALIELVRASYRDESFDASGCCPARARRGGGTGRRRARAYA